MQRLPRACPAPSASVPCSLPPPHPPPALQQLDPPLQPPQAAPPASAARKRTFFELFLCLSQACLGKMILLIQNVNPKNPRPFSYLLVVARNDLLEHRGSAPLPSVSSSSAAPAACAAAARQHLALLPNLPCLPVQSRPTVKTEQIYTHTT